MDTEKLLNTYHQQLFFFILKRIKDRDAANDIFQNAALKIHSNIHQLKSESKVKAWIYQIVRNEISNYYKELSKLLTLNPEPETSNLEEKNPFCCFDRFINELAEPYKSAIDLVYLKDTKQQVAADLLEISLANLKARVRRGKAILKVQFNNCCKLNLNKNGLLVGETDCSYCEC